jgi:hypothetical protein
MAHREMATSDVMARDNNGRTSLHAASWNAHVRIINLILNMGSNPETPPRESESSDSMDDVIFLLQSLVTKYPTDSLLQTAIGNEYFRRKMYIEAQESYNESVRIQLRNTIITEIGQLNCYGLICDVCHKPIRGYRYKCTQCDWDVDFCDTCYNHSHSSNDILMIPSKWPICIDADHGEVDSSLEVIQAGSTMNAVERQL